MASRKSRAKDCRCSICSGKSAEEYLQGLDDGVRKFGRVVQGVLGGEDSLPFSYTIGNHAKGLPELLVIGTSQGTYMNEMSELMLARGRAFDHGEIISTSRKYRIKIIDASHEAHEHYTLQAGYYYETQDYRVQQIILSDEEGRLPGELGCAPGFADVPVLAAA